MKKAGPPWIIPLVAISVSFIFILCSIVFSHRFQHHIFDLKNMVRSLVTQNNLISYYKEVELFFIRTIPGIARKHEVPWAIFLVCLFFLGLPINFGVGSIKLADKIPNLKKLYKELSDYPHPIININIINYLSKIAIWISWIFLCYWWRWLDFLPMLFCFASLIILLVGGIIYSSQVKKWRSERFW